jgi:hypothetical protein
VSSASLASMKASATTFAAQAAGFGPVEAAAGLLAADELSLKRGGGTASSAGTPPQASRQAVAANQAPLTLLHLPAGVLVLVFGRLDTCHMARVAATCSELYHGKQRPMWQRVCPARLPHKFSSWAVHLAWLESRRDDEAQETVVAGTASSFFISRGRLMSCGVEEKIGAWYTQPVLGHCELDGEHPVVETHTLLPSMAEIRISSISARVASSAAVSAAGTVYTWGIGDN